MDNLIKETKNKLERNIDKTRDIAMQMKELFPDTSDEMNEILNGLEKISYDITNLSKDVINNK
jgi:hypothetical protein